MPSRTSKHHRQSLLIDNIYKIYDALHYVSTSHDIPPESRNIINTTLQREFEVAKLSLAAIDPGSDDDDVEVDDVSSSEHLFSQK